MSLTAEDTYTEGMVNRLFSFIAPRRIPKTIMQRGVDILPTRVTASLSIVGS